MGVVEYAIEQWERASRQAEQILNASEQGTGQRLAPQIRQKLNVQVARSLAELYQQARSSSGETAGVRPYGAVYWARQIADAPLVRESVEQVRRQVFGRPTAPFPSWEAASRWLARQRPRWSPEEHEQRLGRAVERLVHISSNARRPRPPLFLRVGLHWQPLFLSDVPAHTRQLRRLADGVDRLTDLTGWTPVGALQHVLSGVLPVEVQPTVEWTVTQSDAARWATVRVRPWQLSAASWAALLPKVRRYMFLGARGKRRLTVTENKLLDLVTEIGPPPEGKGRGQPVGRSAYWQQLAAAWERTYNERRQPNSLWKVWWRLQKGNAHTQSKGGTRDESTVRQKAPVHPSKPRVRRGP